MNLRHARAIGCPTLFAIIVMLAVADSSTAGVLGDGDDAATLLARCGPPTQEHTTEHDKLAPSVQTLIRGYGHICFEFIPSGAVMPSDPPQYIWKLVGIADATTTSPIDPNEVTYELPCWAAKGPAPTPGSLTPVEHSPFFLSSDGETAPAPKKSPAAGKSAAKPGAAKSSKAEGPHH